MSFRPAGENFTARHSGAIITLSSTPVASEYQVSEVPSRWSG
jgi:hypothetical protein